MENGKLFRDLQELLDRHAADEKRIAKLNALLYGDETAKTPRRRGRPKSEMRKLAVVSEEKEQDIA